MRWPPSSLAGRLSAWYAASTFLLLLVATTFLYWVLVRSFDREDDQYLREKLASLAMLLRNRPGELATVEWEVEGESQAGPSLRVLSRVISSSGRLVVETHGMSRELPRSTLPTPSRMSTESTRVREIRSAEGRTFRALAAYVPAAAPGEEFYTVHVAIDLTYEKDLLAGYRRQLWVVLGMGLLVSIVVGHRMAKRGIQPIDEISAAIRSTGSTTLDERVRLDGLPAELRELAETFNDMLDRLGESFGRLSRFSSDIAHELRTPVNNLLGEVDVTLVKTRSPEEYREILGSLSEECLHLSRLIDSLLFLARAEHPQTQIQRMPLEIGHELEVVREFYEAAATEAGIHLQVWVEVPVTATLDRTLLQRAVGNLVQNALAHTASGGHVRVSSRKTEPGFCIEVADDGIGIASIHLSRIFDRFYRVDAARSKDTGGTGLGLAIVQSIAKLHGGSVEIESQPGQGTQVRLMFPV